MNNNTQSNITKALPTTAVKKIGSQEPVKPASMAESADTIPNQHPKLSDIQLPGSPRTETPETQLSQRNGKHSPVSQSLLYSQAGMNQSGTSQAGMYQSGMPQVGMYQSGMPQAGMYQSGMTQAGMYQPGMPRADMLQPIEPQSRQQMQQAPSPRTSIMTSGLGVRDSVLTGTDFTQGFLQTQIGRHVKVEFLLGTNMLIDREGDLVKVGTDYIIIQETETDDYLLCDIYSIKFIRFYY